MSIGSVINTGLQGINSSSRSMQHSAQQIASAGTVKNPSTENLVEPLVNLDQQQLVFDASAKVVEAGSDLIGSLLDIKT